MIETDLFGLNSAANSSTSYAPKKTVIRINRNGDLGKPLFSFSVDLMQDTLSKIKKNVLKKLEIADYKDP